MTLRQRHHARGDETVIVRACANCGNFFRALTSGKSCSDLCRVDADKKYRRERYVSAGGREYHRKYQAANSEKIKSRNREYYALNSERINEQNREYRAANLEKIREREREYRAANREKKRESDRNYSAANRGKLRQYHREYYAANSERAKERARKWSADNPKKVKEIQQREFRKTTTLYYAVRSLGYIPREDLVAIPRNKRSQKMRSTLAALKRLGYIPTGDMK